MVSFAVNDVMSACVNEVVSEVVNNVVIEDVNKEASDYIAGDGTGSPGRWYQQGILAIYNELPAQDTSYTRFFSSERFSLSIPALQKVEWHAQWSRILERRLPQM